MGLDFKIKDFAYPISILKLKRRFEKNQWLKREALYEYQLSRLKIIINHAYKNVPYYQNLFKKHNIIPSDIRTFEDFKNIPFLTKDILKTHFNSLIANDAKRYRPHLITTSGTTGGHVKFYIDKPSNILEFVYYWRFWEWAGYTLRDTFAEFSAQFFTPYEKKKNKMCHFEHITRRLILNSLLISRRYVDDYVRIFRKFKPLFLKGLPSNLYMLALLFNERKNHGIVFKAVFSQGENLLKLHRDLIEKVFSCKVFDSYGHLERTAAISECPLGAYHIHLDYGLLELAKPNMPYHLEDNQHGFNIGEIIGTSLYNFGMPLIRYRSGDLAITKNGEKACLCNRGFPTVESILGRDSDIIITPDGRAITALYVALDRTPGIILGQIVQEDINRLIVKIVTTYQANGDTDRMLINNLRSFVGNAMDIKIIHVTMNEITRDKRGKFRSIVSKIQPEKILS